MSQRQAGNDSLLTGVANFAATKKTNFSTMLLNNYTIISSFIHL